MALHIQLLGEFIVWRNGRHVEQWPSLQPKTLLKILLTRPGEVFLNDQLIEYVWPDDDYDKALGRLRARIHDLRTVLEPESQYTFRYVQTRSGGYRFNVDADCTVDVLQFSSQLDQARHLESDGNDEEAASGYEAAIQLYAGDYLPEDRYQDWALREHDRLRDLYADALRGAAQCRARQGQYRRALRHCRRLLSVDPFRQVDVYRMAMLFAHLMGNPNEALQLYRECEQALREHLDVAPDDQTRTLYEQIAAGHVPDVDPSYPTAKPVERLAQHSLGHLPFVGREREYAWLIEKIQRTQQGQGGLVLIGGQAGVGKSRLVNEAIRYAEQQWSIAALTGQSSELSPRSPYQSLLQALRHGVALLQDKRDALEEIKKDVRVLPQWLPELERLVDSVKPPPDLEPENEQIRLFAEMKQLLFSVVDSCGSAVLGLDDLHWADQATIEFLDYLVPQLTETPLVVLGTYRSHAIDASHPLHALIDRGVRDGDDSRISHIELSRLPEDAIHSLLAQTAPHMNGRDRLAHHLHRESGGNPLFLTAILQTLFETDALRNTSGGHWDGDVEAIVTAERMAAPQRIETIVASWLEGLADRDLRVLQLLSVLGERCSREILTQVESMLNEDQALPPLLDRSLEHLRRAALIEVPEPGVYRVVHYRIRDVVYQRTDPDRRKSLHRQVASVLEADPSHQRRHGVLAHHYVRAGMPEKGLEHLIPALRHAVRGYRHQEGLELAGDAWALIEQLDDPAATDDAKYQVLRHRADIHSTLGDREAQEATLEALSDLIPKLEPRRVAHVHLMWADLYLKTDRYPRAQAESAKVLQIATEHDDTATQADALHRIALVHWSTGANAQARDYLQREYRLRQALDDRRGLAETLSYLGLVAWRDGAYDDASARYREALDLQDESDDFHGKAQTLLNIGIMNWSKGDYDDAIEAFDEGRRISAEIGDRQGEASALGNLGLTHLARGAYEPARDRLRDAIDVHADIGDQRAQAISLNNLGLVHWSLGRNDDAGRCFTEARRLFQAIDWDQGEALTLNNLALIERRSHRFDEARELSRRAIEIHRAGNDQRNIGVVQRNLGEIAQDEGDLKQALEHYEQALVIAQALGSKREEMLTLAGQSAVHIERSETQAALESAEAASQCLRALGASAYAPRVHYVHARALEAAGQDDEASRRLERAHGALMEQAETIQDEELRRGFLTDVPLHREIVEAYRSRLQKTDLSEADCYRLLRETRWPEAVACPNCGSPEAHVHGQVGETPEQRYRCPNCESTFSDRTGTVFAYQNQSLNRLFQALQAVSNRARSASDEEPDPELIAFLSDRLEIHPKTARKLCEKLVQALDEDPLTQRLARVLNDPDMGSGR